MSYRIKKIKHCHRHRRHRRRRRCCRRCRRRRRRRRVCTVNSTYVAISTVPPILPFFLPFCHSRLAEELRVTP